MAHVGDLGAKEAACQLRERLRFAGGEEFVVRVFLGDRAFNGVVEQFAVHILRGLIRGGNQGDVLTHNVGNHAGQ